MATGTDSRDRYAPAADGGHERPLNDLERPPFDMRFSPPTASRSLTGAAPWPLRRDADDVRVEWRCLPTDAIQERPIGIQEMARGWKLRLQATARRPLRKGQI
jgi:hypothetical protein